MADILSQDEIDALLSTVSDEPAGEGSGGDSVIILSIIVISKGVSSRTWKSGSPCPPKSLSTIGKISDGLISKSPHVIQIVAQNEVVVLVVFEVKFGEATGMMNICLPAYLLLSLKNLINLS